MDEGASLNPRKRKRSRFAAALSAIPPAEGNVNDRRSHEAQQVPGSSANDAPSVNDSPSASASISLDLSAIPVAPVSTLKINQHAARAKKIKRSLKTLEGDLLETNPTRNAFYDPDIRIDARTRRPPKPQFNFVAEGNLSAKAEKARHAAERRAADMMFREAMAARAAKAGALPPLPPLVESILYASRGGSGVPGVEWWDGPFLAGTPLSQPANAVESQSNGMRPSFEIREDRITNYVHHPVPIPSSTPSKAATVLPLMLTEKERKRLRRQRRLEKETERREMIAVGLLPPPPPKVKLSNLMRVLANEVTADPTKVEADVRAQVAERLRKHEADNEARKRTKEELREKAEQKTARDRSEGMRVNVYRITSVESAQLKFKIDINARQFGLTGTFIIHGGCNLVIVEGGAKALRKYRNLLLRRIDWDAGTANAQEESLPSEQNRCKLVWEGPIAEAAFENFKTVNLPTEASLKSFLKRRGMEAHYDSALTADIAS